MDTFLFLKAISGEGDKVFRILNISNGVMMAGVFTCAEVKMVRRTVSLAKTA